MTPPRILVLTVDRQLDCFDRTAEHLNEFGLAWERFNGLDNTICRLNPVDTFDIDRQGDYIGVKHVVACLSHYLIWKCMSMQPDESFWVLEYDVRFADDWREKYDAAMSVMPSDWDVIFLGSCCTGDKPTRHIDRNVYEIKYPLCGHATAIRKKALPTLLNLHQKIWAPLDIAMLYTSLSHLRVYTILPAIIGQHGNPLEP